VDILAGRLEWTEPEEFKLLWAEEATKNPGRHPTWHPNLAARRLAHAGGIKWPPTADHLVAIEAKCAYLNSQARRISVENLKSTKSSRQNVRHTRAQVEDLLRMGFNRVALLDILANPPVSGPDGVAWFNALNVADLSRKAMAGILAARLSAESPAGHYVWSAGAVVGGDEAKRGAGYPSEIRRSRENRLLVEEPHTSLNRKKIEQKLRELFAVVPAPRNLRVVLSDCRKCGTLHPGEGTCAGLPKR